MKNEIEEGVKSMRLNPFSNTLNPYGKRLDEMLY